MTKPYACYTDKLGELTKIFGSQLHRLSRQDKLQLRISLSTYVWQLEEQRGNYCLEDSWLDCGCNDLVQRSRKLDGVFWILRGITPDEAESLIQALSAQLKETSRDASK